MSNFKQSLSALAPFIAIALQNEEVQQIIAQYKAGVISLKRTPEQLVDSEFGTFDEALMTVACGHYFSDEEGKLIYSLADGPHLAKPWNTAAIAAASGDAVLEPIISKVDGKDRITSFAPNNMLAALGLHVEIAMEAAKKGAETVVAPAGDMMTSEEVAQATSEEVVNETASTVTAETTAAAYEQLFKQETATESAEEVTVPEPEPAVQTIAGLDSIVLPTTQGEELPAPPSEVVVAPAPTQVAVVSKKQFVTAAMQGVNEILQDHRKVTDSALDKMEKILNAVLSANEIPETVEQSEESVIEDLDA